MHSFRRREPDLFAPRDRRPKRLRQALRVLLVGFILLLLVLTAAALWVRSRLVASLPRLDGEVAVQGVSAPVTIQRDALGVPTIEARSRDDVFVALGFLHAQDRFFQMDLLRRSAAGELAALFGSPLLSTDREIRLHRFRDVARRILQTLPERAAVERYTRGVNAGLRALRAAPFEHQLLRLQPEPWRAEDCILAVIAMYIELQPANGSRESASGLLHDLLPGPLATFMDARGTEWDAPLVGAAKVTPPVPAAESCNLREARLGKLESTSSLPSFAACLAACCKEGIPLDRCARRASIDHPILPELGDTPHVSGSNNWALAGSQTADGAALLAGDMHLGLAIPNTWYRAAWSAPDPLDEDRTRQITGVTLPGAPAMVVGSNGHVAWSFTNSNSDASDLVVLELVEGSPHLYRTPDGPREFARHLEIIRVKGAADDSLEVFETVWGPVIDRDHRQRLRALRWVAHDEQGVNLGLLEMEDVRTLEEAVAAANRVAIPAQNCVIADETGRIAWTIMGPLPRRFGFDGQRPSSWADGTRGWDGYLSPDEYPCIIDPTEGRIWTANARVVDREFLDLIGDAGYVLGARAKQIRDRLQQLHAATPRDFLELQLDDRALFLEPWRQLLLDALNEEALRNDPRRVELRHFAENWSGRASVESVGYRIVRNFRNNLSEMMLSFVLSDCQRADVRLRHWHLRNREGPVWQMLTERPMHLLNPVYSNWEEQILAAVDSTLEELLQIGPDLDQRTWGERNSSRIQHPISRAVPFLGRWLDMPRHPLPGDGHMPRVQSPTHGASQRMVVSPGRENEGFFHMPAGQSGHPLSPHYSDSHAAWEEGRPTSFLPGPALHTLTLVPAGT